MRARDLFLLPAAFAVAGLGLWWGAPRSYVAVRNREPVEVSCADFPDHRPDAEWVILTGCRADLDHASTETWIQERPGGPKLALSSVALVPLRAEGQPRSSPAPILVYGSVGRDRVGRVEGLVELSLERSAKDRAELQQTLHLADDFVILDRGRAPEELPDALGALAAGLAGAGYLAWRIRRRMRRNRPVDLARATVVRP